MESDALPLSIAAWLLTYALHSTVLIGGAWLVAVGLARIACHSQRLRDRLPSLRERLWKVALVGGIVTATVQTGLGVDPWGLRFALATKSDVTATADRATREADPAVPRGEANSAESKSSAPLTFSAAPATESAVRLLDSANAVPPGGRSDSSLVESATDRSGSSELKPVRTRDSASDAHSLAPTLDAVQVVPTRSALVQNVDTRPETNTTKTRPLILATSDALDSSIWVRVVLYAWIVGVAFGLGRWVCQWNRLLRRLDDREPVVSGRLHDVFHALRSRSKATANTTLCIAPGIAAPITLGLRRLEVCLPPRAAHDLQHEELEALLAHELAHAERRDPAWLTLCRFIEVFFFFQPLNRVCSTWLEDEAEYLCDDWAIVHVGERIALASCLTEIAGWIVHDRDPALVSAMAARGTRLSTRVRRLLDEEHEPSAARGSAWITLFGSASALGVALLVPGVAAATRAPTEDTASLSSRMDTLEASLVAPATDDEADDVLARASATKARASARVRGHLSEVVDRVARDLARSITTATPRPASANARNTRRIVVLDSLLASVISANPAAELAAVPDVTTPRAVSSNDLSTTLVELDRELSNLRAALADRGTTDEIEAQMAEIERQLASLHERAAEIEEYLRPNDASDCASTPCADAPDTIQQSTTHDSTSNDTTTKDRP